VTTLQIALFLFAILAVLLVGGVWIALSLAIVAWAGLMLFSNSPPDINLFTALWGSSASWTLAALPLFIWMGEILYRTRLSDELFSGLAPWLDRVPGRLMHVNILGCGIFGIVSGSSAATCATVAKVNLPELKRRGYDEKICLGSLCGAGTLGILLPPSIIMVVYAVAADVSIIRVFFAGFLPGLLVMVLYSGYIVFWALRHPDRTPPAGAPLTLAQKISASRNLIPVATLTIFVIWVMVAGYATATEAAAFSVIGALGVAAWNRSLTWRNFADSLLGATRMSCMIMFILGCASFLTVTMGFTGVPRALAEWVASMELNKFTLIGVLCLIYLLLGTALDGISMIVLTTSVVIPIVQRAGIDLVWFGIFIVLLVEIAEVTPPLGFNLFVLQTMTGKDGNYVAWASLPFFFMLLLAIVIITVFPGIVTWLPDKVV
jgi:tripartite ATP-independent transporter DctM subunit